MLARYFHTIRHMKPVQIYGRIARHLSPGIIDASPAPRVRTPSGAWTASARRKPSLIGASRFSFLNEVHEVTSALDWTHRRRALLWLYNLHYFDDLNAENAQDRATWHRDLMRRWILENPPGRSVGWDPYPTSLRIVNWIKWALSGNALEPEWKYSLAIQVRHLARRLETHLLGNHLFANAKALVFAGLYFEGGEAQTWLSTGLKILSREAQEQILPDGGQFELSTMYHALALEDVLDLCNIVHCFGSALTPRERAETDLWFALIGPMRRWLAVMCHPDGEIAFFNDAAIGIAPSPAALDTYAEALGFSTAYLTEDGVTHLADSGYIRVQTQNLVALLDVAQVGPSYLPGHGHADTLTFEMSLHGQRVVVNSGTSQYGAGEERHRQRGTAAHNTVLIDGENSSEVWSGFRVARRAHPFELKVTKAASGEVLISCAHDGYRRLRGAPIHRRSWRFAEQSLEIIDVVEGNFQEAIVHFHLEPSVLARRENGGCSVELLDGTLVSIRVPQGGLSIEPSSYHPEFGRALSNIRLSQSFSKPRNTVIFSWT